MLIDELLMQFFLFREELRCLQEFYLSVYTEACIDGGTFENFISLIVSFFQGSDC